MMVLWDKTVELQALDYTNQLIHCHVGDRRTRWEYLLTGVYASNEEKERVKLWEKLESISQSANMAWIVCGDFNNVLKQEEKLGGQKVLQAGISDHASLLVQMELEMQYKKKPFKYFNMWKMDSTFLEKVEGIWNKRIRRTKMFQVVQKLKILKKELLMLNKNKFSSIQVQVQEARMALEKVQKQAALNPDEEQLHLVEREAYQCYISKYVAFDSFMRQKVKEDWIKDGDTNSQFFHSKLKQQMMRNRIWSITSEEGEIVREWKLVEEHFLNYFQNQLGQKASRESVREGEGQNMPEAAVIWSRMNVPKHVFTAWLIWKGKLWTRDRLMQYNISVQDENCCLCTGQKETIEHLFFLCPFSSELIGKMKNWLGIRNLATNMRRWKKEGIFGALRQLGDLDIGREIWFLMVLEIGGMMWLGFGGEIGLWMGFVCGCVGVAAVARVVVGGAMRILVANDGVVVLMGVGVASEMVGVLVSVGCEMKVQEVDFGGGIGEGGVVIVMEGSDSDDSTVMEADGGVTCGEVVVDCAASRVSSS
ncbi:OLC1v1005360C1 [Oldenlandia corymbosa var. corymbosa]|uniref:OLC1v1005360C1 n=1 Tax=Oldenlandia corymbosa var. corymbosa TaxID=529605 RepID=A0AAV1DGT7_OLDCO|nr:OLC1v1005360C1 [Oldenlandia corymbosa var. corymbosa]